MSAAIYMDVHAPIAITCTVCRTGGAIEPRDVPTLVGTLLI